MDRTELSEKEMQIFASWKMTYKTIFNRIFRDTYACTGISEGDFMVLDLLSRSENNRLRQSELAESMDWTKSRLSHHLTRMEKRDLVVRQSIDKRKGVLVTITKNGRAALDMARPVILKGVKEYFIDQLTQQDIESITRLAEKTLDDKE